ncbi:phosphatase PAP2 family protein [Hymenobacter profundi]|uniref:Phosphatase PAP2 family protein n=1 Tax=Hymenobacter profundi TaxID=1982110 RepID=A0ABS6WU87_9BACT|nr:phosphatase PAP2 family protein [Hymenobacter profundi]MBW3127146.1 phosphatase PAP2 family protein [Hymenobacter profundi]
MLSLPFRFSAGFGLVALLLTGKSWAQALPLPVAPADSISVTVRPLHPYRPTLRQLALPAALLGVAVLSTEGVDALETDEAVQEEVREHFPRFQTSLDDQLRHVPAVATLGLSLVGVKGVHSTANQGVIFFLAYTINNTLTSNLKNLAQVERPYGNQDYSSFPSQHTSAAFAAATFMHREYGGRSVWYSVGGYSVATATAAIRVLGNKHWLSDVLAGAGVGILSTELAYWAYPLVHRVLLRGLNDRAMVTPYYSNGAVGAAVGIVLP